MKNKLTSKYQIWIYGTVLVSASAAFIIPGRFLPAFACIVGLVLIPAVTNALALLCLVGLVLAPRHTRILYNAGEFFGQFAVTIDAFLNVVPGNPYALGYAGHLLTLANLLTFHESFGEAEALMYRQIALIEKTEGVNSLSLIDPLSLMISVLRAQGKFDESTGCGERLLALSDSAKEQEVITIASALGDLCASYAKRGQIKEAEATGERALQLIAAIPSEQIPFGKDQLLATAMSNLGCVYDINGKYDASLRMFQRALELKKKTMKSEDPSLAMGYINVSQGYLMQEKFDDALQAIQSAMSSLEVTTAKDSLAWATALQNRGDAYRGLGQLDAAEKSLQEAFVLKQKLVPANDIDLADMYLDMAKLYREKQEFERSEKYFKDAILQVEKLLRPDHPKMMRFLTEYAKFLKLSDRHDEIAVIEKRIASIKTAH